MASLDSTLERVRITLDAMRAAANADGLQRSRSEVSGWTPAQHLDHLTQVTASMLRAIAAAKRQPSRISLLGRVILLAGYIPRGKGQAPASLHGRTIAREELLAGIDAVERQLAALDRKALTSGEAVVPHPRFGGLTALQALRFAVVHTEHHLKIIRDIGR
ncbi:MAG TPA: DinB family protein [Thermoanaerobaculia bacterium]